jgi:hypothetical protein
VTRSMPLRNRVSTAYGVAGTVLVSVLLFQIALFSGLVGGALVSWMAVVTSLALYPGLATAIAVRSASTYAVAAVAAVMPAVLFGAIGVLSVVAGHAPGRRDVAVAVGYWLLYGAIVFGAVLASARIGRRHARSGDVAGFAVGIAGAVAIVVSIVVALSVARGIE